MSIEQLRKVQRSKKSSMSMPLALRILEEHHERLLKLENVHSFSNCDFELPASNCEGTTVTSDLTNDAERDDQSEGLSMCEVFPPIVEEAVTVMEPTEVIVDDNEGAAYLDELLLKLLNIQDEASLLESELTSIKQAEDEQEAEDFDTISECTDACRELLATETIGEHVEKAECKACIKMRVKMHKQKQKQLAKERAADVKKIKLKQRELLILEQQEIADRLKNLQSGKGDKCYNVDKGAIAELVHEIDVMAGEYAVNEKILY